MKVLVTGATGVVGRRLLPLLGRAGHEVTAVVRSAPGAALASSLGATPSHVNLFDAAAVRAAMRGMDVVVNLATSIPPSSRVALPWAWSENSRIRREVSANIADAAIAEGTRRYIQESFAPIYADNGAKWIDEKAPTRPASYNRAIVEAEQNLYRFASRGVTGAAGVVLRFSYFYGPDSDFVRAMVRGARRGVAVAFGSPDGYVSSISHDDAATAVLAAFDMKSGTYNVTDDEPVTRREFFDTLAKVSGAPPPRFAPGVLRYLFGSLGETLARSQRISNGKFRDSSDWAPAYRSVREGFATLT